MKHLLSILCLLSFTSIYSQNTYTISGYITDASNAEALIGANVVFDLENQKGVITNNEGFYTLSVPAGKISLVFSYVGFTSQQVEVELSENTQLNIKLKPSFNKLNEVVVTSDRFVLEEELQNTSIGTIQLTPKEVEILPALGGEVDIIKVAQLMPGISRGAEGTTGLYVRGGTDDQNLITVDDATIYNAGHLFGFFSIFNNDAVQDVTLIKGGFPAQYGGRLSSVMDIKLKKGDFNTWNGKGGIGLLSSRLTVDGPIIKDKLSIMVSGRRTYIDQVLKVAEQLELTEEGDLPYHFYDLKGKISYKLNSENSIYFSTYVGDDVFDFSRTGDDDNMTEQTDSTATESERSFGFRLGNITSTLQWDHIYNKRLFHNIAIINSRFDYDIVAGFRKNSILVRSLIEDYGFKADWEYFYSSDIHLRWGLNMTTHVFRPNLVNTSGAVADFLDSSQGEHIVNQEIAIYAGNEHIINSKWSGDYGFRISSSIVEGAFYAGLEPRMIAKYTIDNLNSAKLSYTFMRQYMHRVSNLSFTLPTDLWYPITRNVKPQESHQIAAGYLTGIEKWNISISTELYYKTMTNLIEYREGAMIFLNDDFEEELITGKGEAYGAELLIRKKVGKFSGWIGYSLAKATRSFKELNRGVSYSARYDRRHDVSLVANFDISDRFAFSMIWVYSGGSRFTPQNGQYFIPNPSLSGIELVPLYTDRNEITLASTHRLDFNFILKNKPTKWFSSEWHFWRLQFL